MIFNSSDEAILPLLTNIGIDEVYLYAGKKIYLDALVLSEQRLVEKQEQDQAYDAYFSRKDEIQNAFNRTLKLVKTMARNDKDLQDRLNLSTGRAQAIEKWIDKGIELYTGLENEPDFLTKLARFRLTAEKVNDEKQAMIELRNLRDRVMQEKGQAQEATRLRNDKLEELEDFCVELKVLAELAVDGKSQLLEKLGLVVR